MLAITGSGYIGCGYFYFYLEHIADYMALLNSSTNFVIYILFSPHFRHTLLTKVCKHMVPKPTNDKCAVDKFKTARSPENMDNAMELAYGVCKINSSNDQAVFDSNKLKHHIDVDDVYCGKQFLLPPTVGDGLTVDPHASSLCRSNATSHETLTVSHDHLLDGPWNIKDNKHRTQDIEGANTVPTSHTYRNEHTVNNAQLGHSDIITIDIPIIAIERPSSATGSV